MSELTRNLTGTQKAALVLMNLGTERAAEVMRLFSEVEAEEITSEILRLRKIDAETTDAALAEFHELAINGKQQARGGREFAAGLLEASFGAERAAGLIDRLTSSMAGNAFEFLDTAEPPQISTLLDGELPETIALVLAHLTAQNASMVLGLLDPRIRIDVAQSIATMGSATPEAVTIVADTLRHRSRSIVVPHGGATEARGGVQPLVDIINRSDATTEQALLEALDARDPALAEEVRSRMLTFADLVKLEDRDVQQVLRGIDAGVLAIAMKGAAPELIEIIQKNMSDRNRATLEEEISLLGPTRKAQVDEARGEVVRSIRELEASGAITVQRVEEEFVD